MSATAYHRCQHCGYENDFSTTMSVFEEDPHCRHCGLAASESDSKMQEELSDLMARNMHLSNNVIQPSFTAATPPTPQLEAHPAPIAYITQHYHHSSHHKPAVGRTEIEPSQVLAAAGIDASVLFPSQILLFKHAAPDQQLRLIQLWQIAPPTSGQQMLAKNLGNWPQTNLEQEEEAARHRWEMLSEEGKEHMIDLLQARGNAEPYMIDGYGQLPNINGVTAPTEYRPKVEVESFAEYNKVHGPEYSSREWWRHVSENQPMEHQYGVLEHVRIYGYGAVDMDGDKEML